MYSLETLQADHPQYQEVLLFYKTTSCPHMYQDGESLFKHLNQTFCHKYHNNSEMRRPIFDEQSNCLLYDLIPCSSMQEGYSCPDGVRCRCCHTKNEWDYHPLYYKTEPCTNCAFVNNPRLCPKYHPEEINRKPFVEKLIMLGNDGTGQFNLDMFKVKPCIKKGNHNLKICDSYHHDKDRRRPSSSYAYAPPMCQYVSKNAICPNGDNCRFAHNKLEQLYHPERHKRKFCLYYPHSIQKCEYGGYCSFAHNESEIVIEMIHNMKQDEYFYLYKYKTVFCPYISDHDRNQCVYAHNPQDLRRDPNQYKYNAVQCFYWSQGQIFSYEEGGCPKQMECENCHGWKELEYHPFYYKTKPCNNGKKCNKKDCPFYHSTSERRQMKVTSQLTRSLLHQSNSNGGSPVQQSRMIVPGSAQLFEQEGLGRRQTESNYSKSMGPLFLAFKTSDTDSSKRLDSKQKRFGESSPGLGSFNSSTQLTEDEFPNSSSYMQKVQVAESATKRLESGNGAAGSLDKNKSEQSKSLFSQPLDLWSSFQPGSLDKFEDFFPSLKTKIESEIKVDTSYDSTEDEQQNKTELEGEKSFGLTTEQFKKALIQNLEKKGLGNTVSYLINPLIDLKALKAFSSKDFHLFPHINTEDKNRIVKIIQDVLEEEALLSEINNTINDCESHPNFLSKTGSLQRYGLI